MATLTFDDGPNFTATARILDILAAWQVQAVFFVLGRHAERAPELVRRIAGEGHVIGAHGYTHEGLRRAWDHRFLAEELRRCQETIWKAARVETRLYRPPHGRCAPWLRQRLRQESWRLLGWDVSIRDWRPDSAIRLAARALRRLKPGSVVLLHDGGPEGMTADRQATAEALPLILEGAGRQGVAFGLGPATTLAHSHSILPSAAQ